MAVITDNSSVEVEIDLPDSFSGNNDRDAEAASTSYEEDTTFSISSEGGWKSWIIWNSINPMNIFMMLFVVILLGLTGSLSAIAATAKSNVVDNMSSTTKASKAPTTKSAKSEAKSEAPSESPSEAPSQSQSPSEAPSQSPSVCPGFTCGGSIISCAGGNGMFFSSTSDGVTTDGCFCGIDGSCSGKDQCVNGNSDCPQGYLCLIDSCCSEVPVCFPVAVAGITISSGQSASDISGSIQVVSGDAGPTASGGAI
eukprot:scaffold4414_cov145-Skeletonema_menzelii.AAC.1